MEAAAAAAAAQWAAGGAFGPVPSAVSEFYDAAKASAVAAAAAVQEKAAESRPLGKEAKFAREFRGLVEAQRAAEAVWERAGDLVKACSAADAMARPPARPGKKGPGTGKPQGKKQ